MSINIGPPSAEELRPRITVIGVGGAGGNAIANMIEAEIEGVDFIVANTDAQALNNSIAVHRIQLGPDITQGLGAGSRPEVGRAAAEETIAEIERALDGVNMVFIAAGMGGGTGTGAAPVMAEIARSKGILTVGVVTKPFLFEGTRRMRSAEAGIDELQKHVDTLIVIPNQNLFLVAKADTTFKEAFVMADEVLQQGVRSITDLIVNPGMINLDFADIRSVMNEMGKAMMGTGEGEGENRALEAAERAIANPLLDGVSMHGAKGVIISIIGGDDMRLLEVDEAANHIREMVDPEANIIWGTAFNPELSGKIRVSVVATGIEFPNEPAHAASRSVDLGSVRGPKMPVMPARTASVEPAAPSAFAPLAQDDDDDGYDDDAAAPAPAPFDPFASANADRGAFAEPEAEQDNRYDPAPRNGAFQPAEEVEDPFAELDEGEAGEDDDAFELGEAAELELSDDDEEEPASRADLLGDASRLAEADEPLQPQRRRRILGGSAGEDDEDQADITATKPRKASGGGTLFERMANLSRSSDEEEDESDDGGAMRIPRFLGRQNNQ